MRPDENDAPWKTIGQGTLPSPLAAGRVTNIDFWHADQALSLFVENKLIAHGEYDWTPAERIKFATTVTLEDVFNAAPSAGNAIAPNLLAVPRIYKAPAISMDFSGGAFTLVRVALARDIHYQSVDYPPFNDPTPWSAVGPHSSANRPAAATHPRMPLFLGDGEYFFCGDNSPQSLDARMWDVPNPWMAQLEPKTGVVTRDALIGRAFVVYWPGFYWKNGFLPIPDTGRVRQVN